MANNHSQGGQVASNSQKLVPIGTAAGILGVSIDTLRRWDKRGLLNSTRPDNKNRRFDFDELEKFRLSQPLTISEASKRLGISKSTLRRLEERGLITPSRNGNGERVYSQEALKSLQSAQYAPELPTTEAGTTQPSAQPGLKPLPASRPRTAIDPAAHLLLGEQGVALRSLWQFKQRSLWTLRTLAGSFFALVLTITVFFWLFPAQAGRALGYYKPKAIGEPPSQYAQEQPGVAARYLKPFSAVSLAFLGAINPELKQKVVGASLIPDVNSVFAPDEEGNITSLYSFTFPHSSYLKMPDKGLVTNLNADYLRGKTWGEEAGDLAVLPVSGGPGGDIRDLSITADDLADGSITVNKLESGAVNQSITVVNNSSNGGDITDVVAGAGLFGGASEGSATLHIGGSPGILINGDSIALRLDQSGSTTTVGSGSGLEVTANGLSFIKGCSSGEILKWDSITQLWSCSVDLSGAGSLVVRESDGSPTVSPAGTIEFGPAADSSSEFIVTDEGGGVARVRIGSSILTSANYSGTLDPVYVNVDEAPAAGDIAGSFAAGLTINPNSVALTTDTTGDYVATLIGGAGLTGSGTGEGSTPTLAVVSANGGIVVNADNIALNLQGSADALSTTISSGSGMEILASGLSLLQGCSDTQILKWNETTDVWACGADVSGGAVSLQSAYDGGNTITTTDARDISFTLADTTTDSNLLVNIAAGSTSKFAVQKAGADIFSIDASGYVISRNTVDSTAAFQVQNAAGTTTVLNVDTTNLRVGIGTAAPTATLHVAGGARITGLVSCDTIDTDASGNLACGADATGGTSSLQAAYDGGNTITTTDARSIHITLADTATDQTVRITQAGTENAFEIHDNGTFGDTTKFLVDENGNVGIGVNSAAHKLDVGGTIRSNPGQGTGLIVGGGADRIELKVRQGGLFRVIDVAGGALNFVDNVDFRQSDEVLRVQIHGSGLTVASGDIDVSGVYRQAGTAGISAACAAGETLNGIAVSGGIVTAGTCTVNAADIAENYPSKEQLAPAEIVAIDESSDTKYVKRSTSPYQKGLLGAISTDPAQVLGSAEPGFPVALIGRIPVKVNNSNGPIAKGDYITSSNVAGVGMKATGSGNVIGMALEDFDGTSGSILVFVNPQYFSASSEMQAAMDGDFSSLNVAGLASLDSLVVKGTATVEKLVVKGTTTFEGDIIVQGHIKGNPDTRGRVTVNSGQLQAEHTFAKAYDETPNVVLTPTSGFPPAYRVEATKTGFTVRFKERASEDISFNYQIQE